ncbi:MAG: cell wall biosynthesis glycosyltransferase [Bryobacteraceae bacterium]|nr:cell wall biosynthesis glycosyltransferase [Bryobacteraceae bacterium]MDW8377054.1 cell wall biosynthesis glycosyltransferase [Bryobacterales bacterium]
MSLQALSPEAVKAAEFIRRADIVVGIPSYNNARTIGHVVRAVYAGLAKFFPQLTAVIVNSDGGSTDRTRDEVLSARVDDQHLLLMSTPAIAAHRLSFPYHGIPGKGSAFRLIFEIAAKLEAKVCVVVDADLRSIAPEWMDHLVRPVLFAHYDLVTPYYHRHKYDGTITNNIVYPLTRCLYGQIVRQPIGGEFAISSRLFRRYLARNDWATDVARFGIDIWMTTVALAEGFHVCQSFLGAKLHDPKDPGSDLSEMLKQVVGSVFALMIEYEAVWKATRSTKPTEIFGFQFDVGVDPVNVRSDRMIRAFRQGCIDLAEIWRMALRAETFAGVRKLGLDPPPAPFHFPDELWVNVIFDFACTYKRHPLERGHILSALTPLYLGRVASTVIEMEPFSSAEVEERIERLCLEFERLRPVLLANWDFGPDAPARQTNARDREVVRHDRDVKASA